MEPLARPRGLWGLVGLEFRVYVPGIRAIIRAVVSVDEFGRLVALEFGVVHVELARLA